MSVTQLQELEEVQGLIDLGQRVGVLTYAEIATATIELGLNQTDVEDLHSVFDGCEIELVEEINPAAPTSLNPERPPQTRTPQRCEASPAGRQHRLPATVPEGHRQATAAELPGRD
jgi:hypothetical protein